MDNPPRSFSLLLESIFNSVAVSDWTLIFFVIILLSVLLFISAMVAGSENAFFSLPKIKIDEFRKNNSTTGKAINFLMQHPKSLLATILITNNFINIAFIISSEFLFSIVFSEATMHSTFFFIFQVVFVTFIIVFLAEITPKIYATQHHESFSKRVAIPIYYIYRFCRPLVWLLVKSTSLVEKRIVRKRHQVTIEDLEHAIEITSDASSPENEKSILKNIVKFGNIDTASIMTSRLDVKVVDENNNFSSVMKQINEWQYSRLPVIDGTFDKVKGILNIKDLLPHIDAAEDFNWQRLLREVYFVPESKKIDDLLREFQQKRVHMAVVVDEYGGCSGIVTMEDILEEIFGEIHDEFDEDEISYSKLDDYTFVFEAKILLNDICRIISLPSDTFDTIRGEAETLGGMLLEIAGKIPSVKEKIQYKNFEFIIESVDKRKIRRVKLKIKNEE